MDNPATRQRGTVFALVLSLAVTFGVPAKADEPFPEYEAIRPNVAFWTRVYSEWSLGQVAVHDLEHPGVVYEVVDLPGPIEERYTEEQQEFIEKLNERWKERLERLEQKIRTKRELNLDEMGWALLISTEAGTDRHEDADERVRTQRGLRERFRRGIELSGRYEQAIREIFKDAGLPLDLAYLPHVESSYQASARSSAGAVGVWQFTRGTGKSYLRIDGSVDERLDPIAAGRGAAAYLSEAQSRFDNWPLALTSYNHGMVGIGRAVDRMGNDYERIFLDYDGRSFGFASKNFYSEFLAAQAIARDPDAHFPEGLTLEPAFDLDRIVLGHRVRPGSLSGAYAIPLPELAAINPAWRSSAVKSDRALPAGLTVWLPAGTLARTGGSVALPEDGTYIVRRGDTLSGIAAAHGMSLGELREANDLPRGTSLIQVGQRLNVAQEPDQSVHVVRAGETLSGIATRYGMTLGALRRLNGMAPSDDLIRAGQRLIVTGDEAANAYVVRRGDTLLGIAVRHGVRLSALLDFNRLNESSTIQPGDLIRIPVFR